MLIVSYFIYTVYIFVDGTDSLPGMVVTTKKVTRTRIISNILYSLPSILWAGWTYGSITNAMSYRGGNVGELIARAFLANGGNGMPNYNLSEDEISSLIAYLNLLIKPVHIHLKFMI